MANHLLNICCSSASKFEYLQVQLIEKVFIQNDGNIDKVLCERQKYWQVQLFMLNQGFKNLNEWYAMNRRDFKK